MWLTVKQATKRFGYSHPESLKQRIRQLREEGKVSDIGDPPDGYLPIKDAPIVILWAHSKAMMIRDDAPTELLNPARGRRQTRIQN